jgi:DNA-binding Xre family transcriptional regulator
MLRYEKNKIKQDEKLITDWMNGTQYKILVQKYKIPINALKYKIKQHLQTICEKENLLCENITFNHYFEHIEKARKNSIKNNINSTTNTNHDRSSTFLSLWLDGNSYAQIAQDNDVSRERIRQIIKKTILNSYTTKKQTLDPQISFEDYFQNYKDIHKTKKAPPATTIYKKTTVPEKKPKKRSKLGHLMDKKNVRIEQMAIETGMSIHTLLPMYYGRGEMNTTLQNIRKILNILDCKFEDIF